MEASGSDIGFEKFSPNTMRIGTKPAAVVQHTRSVAATISSEDQGAVCRASFTGLIAASGSAAEGLQPGFQQPHSQQEIRSEELSCSHQGQAH